MKSRGFVTEKFCWNHYYYYLTNEGINYLREYLHLPPDVVPSTLKKTAPRQPAPRPQGAGGRRGKGEGAPGGEFKPTFDQTGYGSPQGTGYYQRQGGAGRGQPQAAEEDF